MTAREQILADIRRALGRTESLPPAPLVAPLLRIPQTDRNLSTSLFGKSLEKLNGKVTVVPSRADVLPIIQSLIAGKTAVASNAPFLAACGITQLQQVQSGFTDRDALRQACATADFGISSADYALGETGSFVMIASPAEARLISLLPPVHIAVFPQSRIVPNLDALLAAVPMPADRSSSMVLITGPSRTADIEQILVRGVHGPGEVHAVIVEGD